MVLRQNKEIQMTTNFDPMPPTFGHPKGPTMCKLETIKSEGVITPDKWAAQFISDLSLHIVNEDYEALEEIKARSDEVGGIRATLLVNFGEGSQHNRYGIALKDEGTTHGLLMQVLEHLTKPIIDREAEAASIGAD